MAACICQPFARGQSLQLERRFHGEFLWAPNPTDVHGAIDTTIKHGGTGSMRSYIGGNTQGDAGIKPICDIPLAPGGRYFHRFWMKFDSGFHWSRHQSFTVMKWERKKLNPVPGSYILDTMHMYPYALSVSSCDMFSPSHPSGDDCQVINYNFDPQTNTALQNWNEFIVEYKLNSSANGVNWQFNEARTFDGEFALWVNGSLVGRLTGFSWCCNWNLASVTTAPVQAWGMAGTNPYSQINCSGCAGADDGGALWLDDFSMDTTWNSAQFAQGGGGGDVNPPAVPTGLKISWLLDMVRTAIEELWNFIGPDEALADYQLDEAR